MGTFNNEVEVTRTKPLQTVTVPVLVDIEDLGELEAAVLEGPRDLVGVVDSISSSSEQAKVNVSYTCHGASKSDVTRVLNKAGVKYVTGRPTTKKDDEES